ncbi:MAG TPA: transaldolase family protein [Conexibacter sp.]|jgi:transaldolase
MRLFVESGSPAEIEQLASWGVLSGATTSLIASPPGEVGAAGETIAALCDLLEGPVVVELRASDAVAMVEEGIALAQLHEHAAVKLPFSRAALAATSALAEQEIAVELTHVYAAAQALLAAEAGATWVSCPLATLEDASIDAGETLQAVIETLHTGQSEAEVLVSGIRSPQHVVLAARLGAELAAVPPAVLEQMLDHPLSPGR